jgi:rod shape determining protein RodA
MRIRKSILENVDWLTIGLFFILMILGWLNIFAVSYTENYHSIFDLSQNYGKQLLWIFTTLILAWAILMLDSKFFETFSVPIYLFGLLLLIGVLIFGHEIKGSKSWFVIGGIISFQPAEVAKYGTALAITFYLSNFNTKIQHLSTKIRVGVILFLPAFLIMLQPDTGSTLVFGSLILVLFREGLSPFVLIIGVLSIILFVLTVILSHHDYSLPFNIDLNGVYLLIFIILILSFAIYWFYRKVKYMLPVTAIVVISSIIFIFSVNFVFENILMKHQQNRINDLLGITSDPKGAGYNVNQSKIAIGSGGFSGKGFLQGTQTKYDFVPEQGTDFIFCTIGEEWGFIGSTIVISLFVILMMRIVHIAERQKANFNRIYAYCVASILFFHFTINIGMTIGLVPVIGIPLPFFSYGGSSLWSFTVLLFTLIKLDSERKMNLI